MKKPGFQPGFFMLAWTKSNIRHDHTAGSGLVMTSGSLLVLGLAPLLLLLSCQHLVYLMHGIAAQHQQIRLQFGLLTCQRLYLFLVILVSYRG